MNHHSTPLIKSTPAHCTDFAAFLRILHGPDAVFELRVPNCPERVANSFKSTVSGYFCDVETAAREIKRIEELRPPGIYVTLNECDRALLGRGKNRFVSKAKNTTSDGEVLRRRWLFVDIDPKRSSGLSSTDAELAAAEAVSTAIELAITEQGWPVPLHGMSGNGRYLLWRVDLPNDDESKDVIKSVLQSMAACFDNDGAGIDCSTFNASRIIKVLGTVARKGDELLGVDGIEDRPHRQSWFIQPSGPLGIVAVEHLRAVASVVKSKMENKGKRAKGKILDEDKTEKARRYLSAMEPSVEGMLGHRRLFRASCVAIHDFGLSEADALAVLQEAFNPRCLPEWDTAGLERAIKKAREKGKPSTGFDLRRAVSRIDRTIAGGPVKSLSEPVEAQENTQQMSTRDLYLYDLSEDSGRTDTANAIRFIDKNCGKLLHVPQWHKWLWWDGKRWLDDSGVAVQQQAKCYAEWLWSQLGEVGKTLDRDDLGKVQTFIKRTNERWKIADFVSLASTDERIVCQVDQLNSNPMLLNCQNGTFDLLTGEFRKHNPTDALTQLAPVEFNPDAECPRWLETLDLIFDGNGELIEYVQTLLGYSISGDIGEHILPICFGTGCNGKSTIWNTISELLGDYSILANESLLMGDGDSHPTIKASLYQKRFVPVSEPERNSKLREARVKELTGDSTITARRMREDFWSFRRTHKFWVSTNHLPRIEGTDEGIWRRVKLIPFVVDLRTKVKPIADFPQMLVRNEGQGIFAWLVRGWMNYQRSGFIEPAVVKAATASYRADSDALGDFLNEHCVVEPGAVITASAIFEAYEASGGKWSKTAFGRAMAERFNKEKPQSGEYRKKTIYMGIKLRDAGDESTEIPGRDADATSCQQLHGLSLDFGDPTGQTEKLGATRGNSRKCQCGAEMVRSDVDTGDGYRNYDCFNCKAVKPIFEGAL